MKISYRIILSNFINKFPSGKLLVFPLVFFLLIGINSAQPINYDRYDYFNHNFNLLTLEFQQTDGTKFAENSNSGMANSQAEADTSSKNSIDKLYYNGQSHVLELELEENVSRIEIKIYNLIGKDVKTAYEGKPKPKGSEYHLETSELPRGVYICTVLGKDFLLTRKFIVKSQE